MPTSTATAPRSLQTGSISDYIPPTGGILSYLPPFWVPYAELARIDKPSGYTLVYFPHLFGTLYAAATAKQAVSLAVFMKTNAILLLGSILTRSAVCSWNDIVDRDLDRQVRRCSVRPIARRAISPAQGLIQTSLLTVMSLGCLYVLPRPCWVACVPDVLLMAIYPFTKRFMDMPQFVLGLQVALALFIGGFAIDEDFVDFSRTARSLMEDHRLWALASFYVAHVCWTIVYDTVYAQQDVEEDAKAGIGGMAVTFGGHVRELLWTAVLAIFALLIACGHWQRFGPAYSAVTCVGTMTFLMYMISVTELGNPSDCAWFFRSGQWLVNLSISAGLALEWAFATGQAQNLL